MNHLPPEVKDKLALVDKQIEEINKNPFFSNEKLLQAVGSNPGGTAYKLDGDGNLVITNANSAGVEWSPPIPM